MSRQSDGFLGDLEDEAPDPDGFALRSPRSLRHGAHGVRTGERAAVDWFSEYRIEPGRYRVTFRGGPGAPFSQVADFALLRAADLAIADGYDWFRITDRQATRDGQGGPQLSVGAGGGSSGHSGGVGVGLGTSFNLGGGPQVSQTLEVMMGRGPRPAGGDVYDARQIRQVIGARV